MGKLTATKISKKLKPGRYGDGDGLFLLVGKTESKSWVLRVQKAGRRRDIGLGSAAKVSLKLARERAAAARSQIEVTPTISPKDWPRRTAIDRWAFLALPGKARTCGRNARQYAPRCDAMGLLAVAYPAGRHDPRLALRWAGNQHRAGGRLSPRALSPLHGRLPVNTG